jgi:hypothetical protein
MMARGGDYSFQEGLRDLYNRSVMHLMALWLRQGHNVVVDTPAHTKRLRKVLVDHIHLADPMCRIVALEWPWPSAETSAVRRCRADSRGLTQHQWEKVAQRHFDEREQISITEGFDKVRTICHDYTDIKPD